MCVYQQLRVVDALCPRADLLPPEEHVVRVGEARVVGARHGVEGPHHGRVAVQDEEVRLVLGAHQLAQLKLLRHHPPGWQAGRQARRRQPKKQRPRQGGREGGCLPTHLCAVEVLEVVRLDARLPEHGHGLWPVHDAGLVREEHRLRLVLLANHGQVLGVPEEEPGPSSHHPPLSHSVRQAGHPASTQPGPALGGERREWSLSPGLEAGEDVLEHGVHDPQRLVVVLANGHLQVQTRELACTTTTTRQPAS